MSDGYGAYSDAGDDRQPGRQLQTVPVRLNKEHKNMAEVLVRTFVIEDVQAGMC